MILRCQSSILHCGYPHWYPSRNIHASTFYNWYPWNINIHPYRTVCTDIRRDIHVTWISLSNYSCHHGYPCSFMVIRGGLSVIPLISLWEIIRASMDILTDIHGKPRISTRISSLTWEHGPFEQGMMMSVSNYPCSFGYPFWYPCMDLLWILDLGSAKT